ncbi:hypothetical protein GZH46_02998, partial [Fragariocoptes setiger]
RQHRKQYNYYESRPYTRSDDWLKWSVRVRVVISSLGQIALTTGFAVIIIIAFSPHAGTASVYAADNMLVWHLLTWQDYLFIVELWALAIMLSLSVGVALVYLLFPIIELSLCLDEIKLKMCIVRLLLHYTRPQLLHSFYSLARELNINDVDEINEIRHRRMQAFGSDCRIKSLPDFLIIQCAAANHAHTVNKLLDDVYFDFYLFVHQFDAARELASALLYIVAATFIALMAGLIYFSTILNRLLYSGGHRDESRDCCDQFDIDRKLLSFAEASSFCQAGPTFVSKLIRTVPQFGDLFPSALARKILNSMRQHVRTRNKLDTILSAICQFTCGEEYYLSRRVPHKRCFPSSLFRVVYCLKLYIAIKMTLLTQLIGFSIQLKRHNSVDYWWLHAYNDVCFFQPHSDANQTNDCTSIKYNCSHLALFRRLHLDLNELIQNIGDPYRQVGNQRIVTYCLISALSIVTAVVIPLWCRAYQFKHRYLEYAINPYQTLQLQAQCVKRHQAYLKHSHSNCTTFDYYRSRPYGRSDDWLKWSVRLRVVIALIVLLLSSFLIMIALTLPFIASVEHSHDTSDHPRSISECSQTRNRQLSFMWQDCLLLMEMGVIVLLGTIGMTVTAYYFLFPILEMSFWLEEIKLQMVICTMLLRQSRQHLRQVRYSLANSLNMGDIMTINHQQSLAVNEDCRIRSLPLFIKTFKLNTSKRYQQLMMHNAALNCCLTNGKLLENTYFNFYMLVYEFESINELVGLNIIVDVLSMAIITLSVIYLWQYLLAFDFTMMVAMLIAYVNMNMALIAGSAISLKIKLLCPIIFSILSVNQNPRRHKIWIKIVERYFHSNNERLGFRVMGLRHFLSAFPAGQRVPDERIVVLVW